MYLYANNRVTTPNLKYANSSSNYCVIVMLQNLKKVLKSKIFKFFSFLRQEVPFKASNNREAVVVCAKHVVKRPSKRSVLVVSKITNSLFRLYKCVLINILIYLYLQKLLHPQV